MVRAFCSRIDIARQWDRVRIAHWAGGLRKQASTSFFEKKEAKKLLQSDGFTAKAAGWQAEAWCAARQKH